ncbi:hypothetical protein AX15_001297 [Amanita polypyramis BW_CC]|nr:hypothetical protein AX15_001297 [Amanita polypyramis BW_CC]
MSTLDRSVSRSPRRSPGDDMDIDKNASPPHNPSNNNKSDMKVVIVTNLTRNVVESHLQTIFGFYGEIVKVDLPLFGKSGQNRGKAALEFVDAGSAQKAASHMDGGQLDGAIVKVELSDLPIRTRSRSPRRGPGPPPARNGRDRDRFDRGPTLSRSRSRSKSKTRSRSPVVRRDRMDVVAGQAVIPIVLPGILEVVLVLVPHLDVWVTDLVLGGDPPVTPEEGMAACAADLGRVATASVRVVRGQDHIPGLGLTLVRYRTRPIPGTARAEAVRGRSVGGGGVIVVMILGTVDRGHRVKFDSLFTISYHVKSRF